MIVNKYVLTWKFINFIKFIKFIHLYEKAYQIFLYFLLSWSDNLPDSVLGVNFDQNGKVNTNKMHFL